MFKAPHRPSKRRTRLEEYHKKESFVRNWPWSRKQKSLSPTVKITAPSQSRLCIEYIGRMVGQAPPYLFNDSVSRGRISAALQYWLVNIHTDLGQQSLKQEFKIIDPVRNYKMANTVKKDRFLTGLTAMLRAARRNWGPSDELRMTKKSAFLAIFLLTFVWKMLKYPHVSQKANINRQ